ncbi:ribonuclease H-like domain-containing protein [Tanacetum coccineum]
MDVEISVVIQVTSLSEHVNNDLEESNMVVYMYGMNARIEGRRFRVNRGVRRSFRRTHVHLMEIAQSNGNNLMDTAIYGYWDLSYHQDLLTLAREIEKLPAEMADAEKRARATPINSESKSRTLDKTILNLEMKSAVDWSMLESIVNGSPMSEENTRSSVEMKKCLMVVGVNTVFSCREGRGSVRATWIHQGRASSKCGDNVFVGLNTDVPWIMYRQDDGRDSICMTRSSTKELLSPFKKPEQKFRSKRRLFDTPSLVESNSSEFDRNFDIEEQSEEEERETMTETMEQYMSKTRENYGSGVTRPMINQDTPFELKGKFLKELRDNTFSDSEHEDANEHIEKVLEIVDLFHIPKVTQDQIMLRAFLVSLTGAASRWRGNQPSGLITTWKEPDESLFRAWERFKELLMKCPQHYLSDMQEVILFYNGLDVPTRQILDSKGAIPSKTAADAKVAIQEMAEYSQKWHNGTSSRTRSTETFDGLAAIQAQLNNLRREIKKVNEKVYAAQVGCELCQGPHYTKYCSQKEEGKTLEETYYTQFDAPYQPGGQYRAAGLGFYQQNNGNSLYPDRRPSLGESLTKFMAESAKRHEENSNIIKEI